MHVCFYVCVCTCLLLCGAFVHVHFCGFVDVGFCTCELLVDVCYHNLYEGSVRATTTPASATRPGEAGGGWGAWDAGKRMLFLSTSIAYSLAMHQKNAAQILAGRLIFQTSVSKLED